MLIYTIIGLSSTNLKMTRKLKKWDKYANLSKFGIIKKKLRDKTYFFLTGLINLFYHRKLSKYPKLKSLIVNLAKANHLMSADISDCLALYEDILQLKPNFILELGPGTSTAAICLAINQVKEEKKDYDPVFIAIESREEWLNYQVENIPKEVLSNVEILLREEKVKTFKGNKVAYYENIPIYKYDYIHVDGPDIHGLGVDLQLDMISLENHIDQNCVIVFDGRRNASRFSRKNMSGFYFRRHSKTLNHIISKNNIKNGFFLDFLIRN